MTRFCSRRACQLKLRAGNLLVVRFGWLSFTILELNPWRHGLQASGYGSYGLDDAHDLFLCSNPLHGSVGYDQSYNVRCLHDILSE